MFYLSRGEKVALVLFLVLLLTGASTLTYAKRRHRGRQTGEPILASAPTKAHGRQMVIRVSGAVAMPGLYGLPAGARLGEAISAAGGAAERADLRDLDLSVPLRDGESVLVPYRLHVPVAEQEQVPVEPIRGAISLNRASKQELESLPGIGPVYAEQIIAYRLKKMREEGRGFQSTDELLNIPGIGPRRFAAVKDLVAP